MLEAGLEPAQPQWPRDFKSLVSTIPPFEHGLGRHKGTHFFQYSKLLRTIFVVVLFRIVLLAEIVAADYQLGDLGGADLAVGKR